MKFKRTLQKQIIKNLSAQNAVIIYGARQVGKTTLIKDVIKESNLKTLFINADLLREKLWLESLDLEVYKTNLYDYELLVIDEAQRVSNIGLVLKIIVDEIPNIKILVSGSSNFDLANQINEPLTGRKTTFKLFPISIQELKFTMSTKDINDNIGNLLIYGQYPKVLTLKSITQKKDYLYELTESYLFKDVLNITQLRKSPALFKLLQLLAYQIGQEVSATELSNSLDLDKNTIFKYLDILEKNFVIYSLSGYSGNLRKEVTKSNKYYFVDLGIRNALIDNFKELSIRNDTGALWENFLINERIKFNTYNKLRKKHYFWRVYTGGEIDFIESLGEDLYGFEVKYSKNRKNAPPTWTKTYPNAKFTTINKDNWLEFVLGRI